VAKIGVNQDFFFFLTGMQLLLSLKPITKKKQMECWTEIKISKTKAPEK
jgi:hypothetical protein